jgi:hypothetical protein
MEIKVYRKINNFEKVGSLTAGLLLVACGIYGDIKYKSLFIGLLLLIAGILVSSRFFVRKEYDEEVLKVDKFEEIK